MAVVAWDCADDKYRERAYNEMAAEIEQLRSDLELRNQTAVDRLAALKKLEPENGRLREEVAKRHQSFWWGGFVIGSMATAMLFGVVALVAESAFR